ncbi:MAG TPA: glycosyltransferase family 39 protein [Terriglobia bacterium]|nr:glycosyltransferase family 39 protein [Terriglobia bacterium]
MSEHLKSRSKIVEAPRRTQTRDLGILAGLAVILNVPFIGQAFHIDDVLYLDIARNVFKNPLFPLDMAYVFEGKPVTMWGHTHPPLNSYLLAGLMLLRGGPPSEVFLHGSYLLFPLLATVSFYFLAQRFVLSPLLAGALFLTVPALAVTAHTLMADVPMLALWLAATALFISGVDRDDVRLEIAALLPVTAAIFLAYQGLALIPLLALYAFQRRRLSKSRAVLLGLPALALFGWQFAGYLHKGNAPASALFHYLGPMGLWRPMAKVRTAASTLGYLGGVLVPFPFLFLAFGRRGKGLPLMVAVAAGAAGVGLGSALAYKYSLLEKAFFILCFAGGLLATLETFVLFYQSMLGKERDNETVFLSLWFVGVLTYCVLLFPSGSARYLLPAAPPLILLLLRGNERRLESSGGWRTFYTTLLSCQLILGLALAYTDYTVASTYREFSNDFAARYLARGETFLFSGEWGFHYYLAALGGEVMTLDSVGRPGELVVKSRACLSQQFDSQLDHSLRVVEEKTYRIRSPIRLLDKAARAGFWNDGWGVLPFWFSERPIDEIAIYRVGEGDPPMDHLSSRRRPAEARTPQGPPAPRRLAGVLQTQTRAALECTLPE